jgi:hypothetical protein
MKNCITQFLVLSLMIQSLGQVLFFADAHALTFNPFVAEISSTDLDYSSDVEDIFMDGDDSGANLTEDELAFIQLARLMERQHIHCTAAGDGKGYKLGIIFDPDDTESPKSKTIDCNEVAKFMFTMNKSGLENTDLAFACFTQDWDYDTKLDFFNNLEDVAVNAEKHFNCPGKDMNAGKSSGTDNADNCMKDAVCSAYNEVPSVVKVVMIPVALAGNAYCKDRKSSTDSGCFSNMLWGVWKSLIGNVEGLWSLAGMAWEGAKSLGRALCFWCEDEVQEAENATAVQLHALNNQSDGFFTKFTKSPVGAITEMFSNFFNGMKSYIADSVQSNFMCLNWGGTRNLGAMAGDVNKAFTGDDSGQAKCAAEDRYVNWDCATCAQKFNMFCGIGGFLGGEVIASFFMGKALSGVGQLASKTAKLAKGTKAGQALGRGFTSLSKTQSAKLLAELGVKAIDGVKLIAYTGHYSIFKAGGRLVAKIGNKIIPITSKRAKILMGLMNGTKKLAGGLYKYTGAKSYVRLLEDSFVLGYQGKAGMKALRAARLSGKMQTKLDVMRAGARGDDAKLAVLGKHQEAITSLGDYQKLLKKAQAAKGEEQVRLLAEATTKRKQYSSLMAEANKASKDFNKALKVTRKANAAEAKAINLANKNRTVTTEAVANSRLTNQARVTKIKTEFSELSKPQVNAVMKAHNKVPCSVGTCTQSQLAEKIRIMRSANIPKSTYREVLRKGLAGSPSPPGGSLSGIRSLNLDEVSSGAMVSVGRSSGGRTNATVARVTDDGVLVTWTEKGQSYTKTVKHESLGTPYELGQKVSVPRSAGGASNGQIVQVLDDDKVIVRFVEGGQEKVKSIELSSLRDPYRTGQTVYVPRSNGGTSEAIISNIDGQKARVSFDTGNGQKAYKDIDISKLQQKNTTVSIVPSNSPIKLRSSQRVEKLNYSRKTGQIDVEAARGMLKELNLPPAKKFIAKDGSNVTLSQPFKDVDGRVFIVAEIEKNGKITFQTMYRSNSQSVYRVLPARNKFRGGVPGYDKGPGEEFLTVSSQFQKEITETVQNKKLFTVRDPDVLEGILPVNRSMDDWMSYQKSVDSIKKPAGPTVELLKPSSKPLKDTVGRSFSKPEDLIIADAQMAPDYSKAVNKYQIDSPVYGKVEANVYKSTNGQVEYTLLRDEQGRVWFGDIGNVSSGSGSNGLRVGDISEELSHPLWEYHLPDRGHSQIPAGYVGKTHSTHSSYSDMWEYIKEIPEIKRWYIEKGIPMPK